MGLLEVLRDLAIVVGVVAAGLTLRHWLAVSDARRVEALQLSTDDQHRATLATTRLEARLDTLSRDIAALAGPVREAGSRTAARVAVHSMLHATRDPFLSFQEIERALKQPAPGQTAVAADAAPQGEQLRLVLMDLVRDRVIAQLDGDRYFIASDFETDDTAVPSPDGA